MDYRDYVRGKNFNFDIISYFGFGDCKKVEYIDIRGNFGFMKTVSFWQSISYAFHIDDYKGNCEFGITVGNKSTEENFGNYNRFNPAFRCAHNQNCTTQIWFGDYV